LKIQAKAKGSDVIQLLDFMLMCLKRQGLQLLMMHCGFNLC
jgi:hypothetical protein